MILLDSSSSEDRGPGGLRRYVTQDLRADAIAGLTVAVMGVPQAMAYAIIAGLAPVYGLYTSIVTCAVAALLGNSRHLVTGPTNGLCMVMYSLTVGYSSSSDPSNLEVILLLSLMSGVIQLGFGLLRLGGIVRYVSNSVVIGFTAGAGILIALNQVKNILGVKYPDGVTPTNSFDVLIETVQIVGDTNFYAFAVGLISVAIVVLAPKLHPRLPGALLGVVVAGVACYLLGWHEAAQGALKVEIVGDTPPGVAGSLDIFHIPELVASPDLGLTRDLAAGAVAMAILGLIEATSISRAVARSSGQRLDYNRDFIGQGASKIVGSFFTCFAGSGSFTRTALNYKAGGRTRMAAVFSAVWTLLTLLMFGPVADFIPKPALAGLLIVTAYSMVDKERLKLSWRSGQSSRMVLVGTLGATLVLPLEWAILFGVFLSFVIILRMTGKTELTQLVPRPGGGFEEIPFNKAVPSPVVTVNMSGDIYFAAAEDLDAELLRCITPKTKVVVLRMKRLRAAGSTAMSMLAHYWSLLRKRNIHLVVCGIEKELEDLMTSSGVRDKIGEANIFYGDNKVFQSTELAMARAQSIAEWMRQGDVTATTQLRGPDQPATAQDIMRKRFVRFGNQHQVREAVWLMSELHKETKAMSPEPMFLQDREGKFFGELSPWRILDTLAAGADGKDVHELDDEHVADLLRRDFTAKINAIARTDVVSLGNGASVSRMLDTAVQQDQYVIAICDDHDRVRGFVNTEDLLRALRDELAAAGGEVTDG